MSESRLSEQAFRDPPARARMAPFWFWNCAMEPERVRRQVALMAKAGCGGFFIHARQGLTLPYLSRAWFERVQGAVEEAKRHGLEAWLYDEFPYPSGIAGGLLTAQEPALKARVLGHESWVAQGHTRREMPLGRVVCALAAPVEAGEEARVLWHEATDLREDIGVVLTREQFWLWPMGHIPTNEKRFMADGGRLVLEADLPPGRWHIYVGIERELDGFKYFDCFFDPLHPGAAPAFLESTHERYAKYLRRDFGTTVPGIFTDEIEPPLWSPHIEAALAGRVDFARDLPALHQRDHPRAQEVRLAVRECALQLFRERWEEPIARWCRDAGLIWAAEKPTWRPLQFGIVAQPSTDAGHRIIGAPPETLTAELRANHRAAMAAAEHQGGTEVRCENFHSLGWGATLQDQKWATDWLAAQGVNRFTPHAFYATSAGLQKHDAAPSFFEENPYWPHFKRLADYTGRLSLALSTGREKARIALLHPTRDLWRDASPTSPVRQSYEVLMNDLLQQHFIFHIVDAQSLAVAQVQEGGLEIGLARYEILLVPPMDVALDAEVESAIARAEAAGLRVLREEWIASLEEGRALSVAGEDGREAESVWAAWREAEGQEILFLANTSSSATSARVRVHSRARSWERWCLETGRREAVDSSFTDEDEPASTCSVDLAAFGSALLVGGTQETPQAPRPEAPARRVAALPLGGEWSLELDRPNALRLNRWRARCEVGDCSGETDDVHWAEVEALPLRYRDTTRDGWRQAIERREGLPVWYRRRVACEQVPEDAAILIEDGAILGRWALWVNGQRVEDEAFAPATLHGSDKSQAPIGHLLRRGENTLALRVEDAPEMGGLRTPLHLVGSFGLRGRALVAPPTHAPFGDLVAAGCPHFSGAAVYSRLVDAAAWAGYDAVSLPPGFGLLASVSLGGQGLGTRAWSPYEFELTPEARAARGAVEVRIEVTNTLLPFYEGQRWDAERHRAVGV